MARTRSRPLSSVGAGTPTAGDLDPLLADHRAADSGPWMGFALAADAAVRDLHTRLGFDLWLVTHVDGDGQVVVASAGPWLQKAPAGVVLPWAQSFCVRMVEHDGPVAVADVPGSARYGPIATGAYAPVQAYLGVPVLSTEGTLFGTLCAFAAQPELVRMPAALEQVTVAGRMLSTIAAGEQTAADRSQDATAAYALAGLDRAGGVRNSRGWEAALATEQERAARYGLPVSVLVVGLDGSGRGDPTTGEATGQAAAEQVLQAACRPGDLVARTGSGLLGVLAVHCDAVSALALARRVRVELRGAGLSASLGVAARHAHETLAQTSDRAEQALERDRQRHRR